MTYPNSPNDQSFASDTASAPVVDLFESEISSPRDLDTRARRTAGAASYPYDAETMQILWDDRIDTGG